MTRVSAYTFFATYTIRTHRSSQLNKGFYGRQIDYPSTIRRHNQGATLPYGSVAPSTKGFGPIAGCQGFAPPLRALDSPKIAVPVMMPAMVPRIMLVMALVMNVLGT